ncbi:hypothetical protein [Roseisolibacter sp. H3M3-2]|uniref:hypothetical protein n=1 Tax=Roseisolibacter sp. H3M3-2 TaxID=3031323 RepID=UPI0023D9D6FA|nr:hypothetical protein [Roseisolibacter sp. H3M3-2]MDF1504078.1 hypothetical protein [Roseisolibacter sp. H3M3-2]
MPRLRFLLALLALTSATAGAQLHVAVRVSPVADLAHQLDCVTGVVGQCATDDYRALWRQRFLRDAADSAAARAWGALRARYQNASTQVDTGGADGVGRQYRWITLGDRWRLAGLQARSWDDYGERLALVLLPQDRARAAAALAHFRPRFDAWWEAEARGPLTRGRDTLAVLLATPELRALLDGARHFYGATGPGSDTVSLTLVARAGLAGRGTSAEVVEGWAVQELLPDASPAREVGVTLHEVAHLLLALAPDDAKAAVAAELARHGLEGRAARSLLDEGLATAFGNGLVERAVRPAARWAAYAAQPRSFYNDDAIDVAGKALMPVLDSLLRAGATLRDPAALAAVRVALRDAMGDGLTRPYALLHDVWGFVDERVAEPFAVTRRLQGALRAGNFSLSVDSAGAMPTAPLARDPWVGAVVIAPASSLPPLAARGAFRPAEVAAIRRAAAAGPVLYGARRANGARTWVVVASSATEAMPLIDRLVALPRDLDGPVP